jgi:hypothetical protein
MYGLFAGDTYYPGGGMADYRGAFASKEDALSRYNDGDHWADDYVHHWEWGHVVDLNTMEVVAYIRMGKLSEV